MPDTTILVAEDNPLSAELMHDHLESLGYAVEHAMDGVQAVEMASSGRFQLLILDVNMPGYDGVQVMQHLRARSDRATHTLKVIVVTADRLATRREELAIAGIDGYLTKPLDLQRLTGEVNRVLSLAGTGGG